MTFPFAKGRATRSPKSLAHLFMREIFAALQSVLAPSYGFDKAVFFVEGSAQRHPAQTRRDCALLGSLAA
jgi:hypothetical protein